MFDDGEIASATSSDDEMPPLEGQSDEENNEGPDILDPPKRDLLITCKKLEVQPKVEGEVLQREHIFHTKYVVQNKVCNVIVDNGCCTNIASTLFVEKLQLPTMRRPKPCYLQWLTNTRDLKITKQVHISFAIGKYEDEVICDVAPMQACHIILGRPWQFDRKVIYDGYKNTYSFTWNKRSFILTHLSSIQAYNDQLRIDEECKMRAKEKSAQERKEKRENCVSKNGKNSGQSEDVSHSKSVLLLRASSFVTLYSKEDVYFANSLNLSFPSVFVIILQQGHQGEMPHNCCFDVKFQAATKCSMLNQED